MTLTKKGVALPSLQLHSDLPREWPNGETVHLLHSDLPREWPNGETVHLQQAVVRTFLWRRVAERALGGTYFGDIPEEVNPDCIADLHRISEAFAAPLANLFAFAKQGHQPCSFTPQKQPALYANPLFFARVEALCVQVMHKSPWSS